MSIKNARRRKSDAARRRPTESARRQEDELQALCAELRSRPRIQELGLRVLAVCGWERAAAFVRRNSHH